jgi:gliding motility-associated-like protein
MSTPGPGLLSSYEICEDPVLITLMDSSIASATWSDGSFGLEVELFQTGNYDVAVSDTAGCIYQFHFALIEDCPNQLFVPNAFSPNGDGMNDRFQPITNHPEHISYGIYDRWGKNVFQAKDGNIAWDGTINGQLAPVGVYVWVLRMEPSEKTSAQKKTGSVTVIR